MADTLSITDLELWTRIGVPREEREAEQRVLVTIEMSLDTRAAAQSDDVKKSINYVDVAEDLRALAKTERKTIERLAEDIAGMILEKHGAKHVAVTVKKFALPGAAHVSITIARAQS